MNHSGRLDTRAAGKWAGLAVIGCGVMLSTAGCVMQPISGSGDEHNALRDIRQETFAPGSDAYASVSPDGQSFVYERFQEGNYDIWVKPTMTSSDSAGRQITFNSTDDRRPAWMGDDAIVFDSWRVDLNQLWRKKATGNGGITLVSRGNHIDMDPDVSINGDVVFISQVSERVVQRDRRGQLWTLFTSMPTIWVLESDGSLSMLGRGISPSWSPDGKQIAFASNTHGNFDIFVMDKDGGNQTKVTSNKAHDIEPCWSPDGRYIAFGSNRSSGRDRPDYNIWIVERDGSSPTQMTSRRGYDGGPSWSPATAEDPLGRIYFHAYRDRDWNIWSVGAGLEPSN
jgi:Tol biopolymer transport system component